MPTDISQLPNLGPTSSEWLVEAGIDTVDELREIGSVEAFVRVKHAGFNASLNLLWALEAGLREVHFAAVPESVKRELLAALALSDPSIAIQRSR